MLCFMSFGLLFLWRTISGSWSFWTWTELSSRLFPCCVLHTLCLACTIQNGSHNRLLKIHLLSHGIQLRTDPSIKLSNVTYNLIDLRISPFQGKVNQKQWKAWDIVSFHRLFHMLYCHCYDYTCHLLSCTTDWFDYFLSIICSQCIWWYYLWKFEHHFFSNNLLM